LVLIAPTAKPPVARIADYGKLKYELTKKEKESRKSSKSGSVKEVKFSPKIAQHDFDVRVDKTRELLEKGYKVKLNIMFRGREMAHIDVGRKVMNRAVEALADCAKADGNAKMEGRNLNLLVLPKKHDAKDKNKESSSETVSN